MVELASDRAQTIANISHRLTVGEMAKQHGDQMGPTVESFLMLIGGSLLNNFLKPVAI